MKYIIAYEFDGYPVIIPVSRILLISITQRKNSYPKLVVHADAMYDNTTIADEYVYTLSEHKDISEASEALNKWLEKLNA